MAGVRTKSGLGVWRRFRTLSLFFTGLLVLLSFALPASAQLNTGRISGQVTDQQGGAIAGATVTVIDVARGENRTLTTDSSGNYAAPNLTPGLYTVRAEFMGFQTVDRQNVQVDVGGDVRVDVAMQPGSQAQTITVTESLPVINTTNAQTGGVLENSLITSLPTIGRNFRWTQQFVPGVLLGVAGTGSVTVDVNGTTDQHGGNSMLDGLYDQTYFTAEATFGGSGEAGFTTILPLDAVQEINLVVNPKAEYGWIPGVTTSIGLKSGTNDLHGSAYAFGRDTSLTAKNAFASARTPVALEQFGGVVGGPIKKDKLFFFAGYEGFRESASSVTNITAPTLSDLGSAPSATGLSIPDAIADIINQHNKASGVNGNTTLSPLSLNIAGCNPSLIPALTGITNTGAQIVASGACSNGNASGAPGLWNNPNLGVIPNAGSSDNGLFKLDYHLNDHHSLNGSFGYGDYFETAAGNSPGKIVQNYWEEVLGVQGNNTERVVEIWTPNSSMLNEARWGRDQNVRPVARAECAANGDLSNPVGIGASTGGFGGPNYPSQYGLVSGANGCGNPTIILSSPVSAQLGFSNARADREVDEQGADSFSYTRGSHQFKFGTDIRAISVNGAKVLDSQSGVINFGQSGFAAFCVASPAPPATPTKCSAATSLEDFLIGTPSAETIAAGSNVRNVSIGEYALFAQDDWRIKPRLTLNLGLREEIVTSPTSSANNLGVFAPSSQTGIVATNAPWHTQYNFEPRVGFAWDITGKGTTTVRAGGGVLNALITLMNFISGGSTANGGPSNYDAAPTGETLFAASGTTLQAPGSGRSATVQFLPTATSFNGTGVVSSEPNPWQSGTQIFPTATFSTPGCGNGVGTNPNPCGMVGGDPNLHYYHYIFWNLNLEHAFTNNISVDVGYVGSRTTGILETINLDQAPPTDDTSLNNATAELARSAYSNPATGQFPWFSTINIQGSGQSDWYRSLQIKYTQRVTHGLTATAAYTYSGNYLTQGTLNINTPLTGTSGSGPYGANTYPDHNLSFTATYEIPAVKKVPAQMLQGWQAHANLGIISGLPVSMLDTKDDISGAGASDPWTLYGPASPFSQIFGRAGTIPCFGVPGSTFAKQSNCVTVAAGPSGTPWANMPAACIAAAQGEPSFPGLTTANVTTNTQNGFPLFQLASLGCYMVNGSAIVPPAQGTYGAMLPDAIKGAGLRLLDMSVTKDWKIKERYTAEFRMESFNLLNRTQYSPVSSSGSNLGAPNTFGLSTNTPDITRGDPIQGRGGAREIQFGLKLLF